MNKITNDIYYIGVNDHDLDLFEGQYDVPNGMAYNSYIISDEKTAVCDTVDGNFTDQWLDNITEVLADRKPDYIIVHHMEPDHSANLKSFLEKYPETTVVGNAKTFGMIENFFEDLTIANKLEVKDIKNLYVGGDGAGLEKTRRP